MELKNYTDGKKIIRATPTMYDMLYKTQGFKPVKAGGNIDKSRSNRVDKPENSTDSTAKATDE